jgi:ribonuclease Z
MIRLILLGTANAIPDMEHENTYMALAHERGVVLVDCVGSTVVRLQQAGISLSEINDLILTHFHPDHVSGVPELLMSMWLDGRSDPLQIYGLEHCLDRLKKMMDLFDWKAWPGFFRVDFHCLSGTEGEVVIQNEQFRILASPVHHLVPTIGLRFEGIASGRVIAYSCDTEPCPEVIRLARNADILLHEASGCMSGHTSAEKAGEIACQAGARRLLLIHYSIKGSVLSDLVSEAKNTFQGDAGLAKDFMELEL